MSTAGSVQYRGGYNLLLFDYPHGTHDIPTCIMISPTVLKLQKMISPTAGFSLGRLHMGADLYPHMGGQVQGDKALIGGTHEGEHRPYGGDLTLIDYIAN